MIYCLYCIFAFTDELFAFAFFKFLIFFSCIEKPIDHVLLRWFRGAIFFYLLLVYKTFELPMNSEREPYFVEHSWLLVFPFITLNILCHSLLICRISAEKSAHSFMRVPLFIAYFFPPYCFEYSIFIFSSCYFNFQCVLVLFGLVLSGMLFGFWIWMSVPFLH